MTVYLDTSAVAKLLLAEAESDAMRDYLDGLGREEPASSMLLETELRRLAVRHDLNQSVVSDVLGWIDLVEPARPLFTEAGLLPGPNLRSLDALHLATALQIDASVVLAYDHRLLEAARAVGLPTLAPA